MKDLLIYGLGGFGHEVACLINHINRVNSFSQTPHKRGITGTSLPKKVHINVTKIVKYWYFPNFYMLKNRHKVIDYTKTALNKNS